MIEKFFTVKPDSELARDLMAYRENVTTVNNIVKAFFPAHGIETSKYGASTHDLTICPTDTDMEKFKCQFKKGYSSQRATFKRNSIIGKAWQCAISPNQVLYKPIPSWYIGGVFGKSSSRLFEIDGVVYCSLDTEVDYKVPDFLVEMKASDFYKVIEEWEDKQK